MHPPLITPKETLKATYSDSGSPGQNATCGTAGCIAARVTIYSYNLQCPVLAGKTCTYDIEISGNVETNGAGTFLNSGEAALYQFLVDGAAPNGGGTSSQGFYNWQEIGPSFVFGTSYEVHSKVTNSVANQLHNVRVNLSCAEILGGAGCAANSFRQTLTVRIFTP